MATELKIAVVDENATVQPFPELWRHGRPTEVPLYAAAVYPNGTEGGEVAIGFFVRDGGRVYHAQTTRKLLQSLLTVCNAHAPGEQDVMDFLYRGGWMQAALEKTAIRQYLSSVGVTSVEVEALEQALGDIKRRLEADARRSRK